MFISFRISILFFIGLLAGCAKINGQSLQPISKELLALQPVNIFPNNADKDFVFNDCSNWGFWEPVHWKPDAAMLKKDWTEKPNAVYM